MTETFPPEVGQVTVAIDQAVATICLDRPAKHNALTPEMLAQLEQILVEPRRRPGRAGRPRHRRR